MHAIESMDLFYTHAERFRNFTLERRASRRKEGHEAFVHGDGMVLDSAMCYGSHALENQVKMLREEMRHLTH